MTKDVRVEINKKNKEIRQSLARLTNHFENWNADNKDLTVDKSINWGHYGDAEKTAYDLKEICDQVFGEGEYA